MANNDKSPQKDKYDFTKLNTLAVVSLASALTGFGVVAAIITGHISLAQIKKTGQNGRPLALAGVILGYAAIAAWIISSIFWFAFAVWAAKNGFGDMRGGFREFGPGMMNDNQ